MADPTFSRYQEAWEHLKKRKTLTLSAPVGLHARIAKAVGKRRDNDIAFRAMLFDECKTSVITKQSDGSKLVLRLTISMGITDI